MSNIDVIYKIKKENLDEKNYFNTLIQEAYNIGLLSDEEIISIQIDLLELLDKRVYRYNGLESSSIRKEILEQIQYSNLYTIGIYLKTFTNPDNAVKEIQKNGVDFLYFEGRKRIDKMLNIIRFYYTKVKQNKLNIKNETYNSTILEGIKGFLKIYEPDFNAQDMKITADYPLYNNLIGKLEGVEFIEKYIKSIYLENKFCKVFSEEKLNYFLKSYSDNYEDLIINIFQIVLIQVIGCILAKEDYMKLNISNSGLDSIQNRFKGKTKEDIYNIIDNAFKEIKIQNNELKEYIEKGLKEIKVEIYNSYKLNNLDKIFINQRFIL